MSVPEHDAPQQDAPRTGLDATRETLLDALPSHVAFDGWSMTAIDAAAAEKGVDREVARLAFPRGVDAAVAFSERLDRRMVEALGREPLHAMGMTAKITRAVRLRLEMAEPDREAVRRAASLFALPIHAGEGASCVWRTADAIWTALGDGSEDLNWYTKRATLAGVLSSTGLYWLQDESAGRASTWAFLDRRIQDVMRIEKAKAAVRKNPLGGLAMAGMDRLTRSIRRPARPAAGMR